MDCEIPQSNHFEGCHAFDKRFAECVSKNQIPPKPNFPYKFKEGKKPWKKDSFAKENKGEPRKEELRRKNLCFTYQQPWVPGHKCEKGKAHYIEFLYEDD